MLTHPTLDQLNQLGLFGMVKAFNEAETSAEAAALTHPEWLALLLDREMAYRHDKKLAARLRYGQAAASRRWSRMSITVLRAASTGRSSRSWSPGIGSTRTTI